MFRELLEAMKQTLTVAALERLIDEADRQIAGLPHGNSVLLPDGRSRPMTVRDQFGPVLASLRLRQPREPFSFDLDPFLDFWRDCVLALDPPAFRPISPQRLEEKGNHAVVIPAYGDHWAVRQHAISTS